MAGTWWPRRSILKWRKFWVASGRPKWGNISVAAVDVSQSYGAQLPMAPTERDEQLWMGRHGDGRDAWVHLHGRRLFRVRGQH